MDKIFETLSDILKRLGKLERSFNIYVNGWTAVTFLNSWVNYDGTYNQCGYLRDPHGFVHLRGLVKNGATSSSVVFTLPAGYRPQYRELLTGMTNPGAVCRIDIDTNGNVIPNAASTTWLSLDNLTFKAYQ